MKLGHSCACSGRRVRPLLWPCKYRAAVDNCFGDEEINNNSRIVNTNISMQYQSRKKKLDGSIHQFTPTAFFQNFLEEPNPKGNTTQCLDSRDVSLKWPELFLGGAAFLPSTQQPPLNRLSSRFSNRIFHVAHLLECESVVLFIFGRVALPFFLSSWELSPPSHFRFTSF